MDLAALRAFSDRLTALTSDLADFVTAAETSVVTAGSAAGRDPAAADPAPSTSVDPVSTSTALDGSTGASTEAPPAILPDGRPAPTTEG